MLSTWAARVAFVTSVTLTTTRCSAIRARDLIGEHGPPASVDVAPAARALGVGDVVQLDATVRAADGAAVTGRPRVAWHSTNPRVASVSAEGLVTALGAGVDTIVASSGALQTAAVLLVIRDDEHTDAVITVNTGATHPVSRYVYGLNDLSVAWGDAKVPNATLNRVGGNRLSAYNWENNYSNAGNDYRYQNDRFMSASAAPGEAIRTRAEATFARGAALLVTVPTLGHVAGDALGEPLDTADATRAARLAAHFKVSRSAKGAPLSLTPDTTDAFVYQDEFVHWLEHTSAAARANPRTPVWYALDNEPDIWHTTHREVTGSLLTYDAFVDSTVAYARAIKREAPNALVFGPVVATYTGLVTLGRYPTPEPRYPVWQLRPFDAVYLDGLKRAEGRYGTRLLDVFDVHWYPQNGTDAGAISNDFASQDVAMIRARLQAPRSLWDPDFDEGSWVSSTTGGPIRLLPRLRALIAQHYPGTKLAITEYYFGRGGDISGGIAQADALGIFGREGVFAAALWPQAGLGAYGDSARRAYAYAFGAFDMFLNYDGAGGRFGDTGVDARTSDAASYSAYASLDDAGRVVLVLLNKTSTPREARVLVTHRAALRSGRAYAMLDGSPTPVRQPDPDVGPDNTVRYVLPPMSVNTLVLAP